MDWDQSFKKKPDKPILTREEQIMAAWNAEAICLSQTEAKRSQYRASSMPICGHYHELTAGQIETVKGQKDFYTDIGTVIHELFQRRFPNTRRGAHVWGNWQCQNPRCAHMHMECCNPDSCEKCGTAEPLYKEVEFTYRGVLGGHVDLLIKLKNGNFWLQDWKTCGTFAIENPQYLGLPYPKNVAQVESYCVALLDLKGIRVEHAFLDYTLRGEPEDDPDNPKNRPYGIRITDELLAARRAQMDRVVDEKLAFDRFRKNRTLANLQAFDKLRPCHSPEDYHNRKYGMQSSFQYHDDKICPFANEQGCFKSGLTEPARLLAKKLKDGVL